MAKYVLVLCLIGTCLCAWPSLQFGSVTPVVQSIHGNQQRVSDPEEEANLLFEGSRSIAKGQYAAARLSLRTLLNLYPRSKYADQAKLLIFLSNARERPYSHAGKLWQDLELSLDSNEPK